MMEQDIKGEPELESISARSGLPVLQCDSVFFNSKFDPLKEAEKFVDKLNLADKKVVIILGGGFYYIPTVVKKHYPSLRVLVVEVEPRIRVMAKEMRADDLAELEIVLSSNLTSSVSFSNLLGVSIAPTQVEFIEHQPSIKRFNSEYKKVKQLYLQTISRFLANLETTEFFGKRWLSNIISNLKLLQERGCFRPVLLNSQDSVVLVVPGPSLDEVIPLLQKNRSSFILLALAPTLRLLEKSNLKPDFVFSMDGGLGNGYHTIGLDSRDIPLLFPLYINSNVLRSWRGPLIPFSFGSAIEHFLLDRQLPEVSEKATVADFALQVIGLMAPKNIFLVGQDFAVIGAKHHCGEYRFEQDSMFSANRCRTILGSHDAQWRDGWVKKGAFSSNQKLLMYKTALLETVNKMEISVLSLTSSPFLEEIPLDKINKSYRIVTKENILAKYTINTKRKAKQLIIAIEEALQKIDNCGVNPQIVDKILPKPGIRAVLELLKATDLYLYDSGDVSKRGNEFFKNISLELKNISKKIENSLNTQGL